jgi:tRNA nucleotidyltransferase (CCA-adding enzyme)
MPNIPAVVLQLVDRCKANGIDTKQWWLVGGVLRDALLGTPSVADIDIAVIGDPRSLVSLLEQALGREAILAEHRFGTVSLQWQGNHIDLAMLRTETYAAPGALPAVEPSESIEQDLRRRDIGINALALNLGSPHSSLDIEQLIDPWGGLEDIDRRRIRVLHDLSFIDDPTRIVRACRYAARLEFALDEHTRELALASIRSGGLQAISTDRLGRELRYACDEDRAGRALDLLDELGVVHVDRTRTNLVQSVPWQVASVLIDEGDQSILVSGLTQSEATLQRRIVRAFGAITSPDLAAAATDPNRWLCLADPVLKEIPEYLLAGLASIVDPVDGSLVARYLARRPQASPVLRGDDLIERGVPAGPAVGMVLGLLRNQRLIGAIDSLEDEQDYLHQLIAAGL